MLEIFRDSNQSKEIEEKGLITVPFLSSDELNELKDFYKKVHPSGEPPHWIDGIHMTSWCPDADYKQKISSGLKKILNPACDRLFKNHRIINHVFIIKKGGGNTNFPIHQDWSIVDESKYPSFNIWIPLQDVDEKNGALWVIEGSQRIKRNVRGAGYLFPDYTNVVDQLRVYMKPAPVKAGTGVVFYHKVIHGSPPNEDNAPRISACISIIPKEAPLQIFYQREPGNPLQVHEPNDEFMFQYENLRVDTLNIPPTQNPVRIEKPFENKEVTLQEMMEIIS